jgi:hypothetical protein
MFKRITKRQKFILTAGLLSAGLLSIQILDVSWRYQAIGGLTVLAYLLSAWSLSEGLTGTQWFTVLILPTLFTLGVGSFYFLIPTTWWTRLPIAALFSFGLYALLLTENIFSVAAIRTIQLLRSAQAVGFLLTIITAFFLYDTILSFRLDPWFNFLLTALVSLPLLAQGLWYINLEERISRRCWFYSLVGCLVLGEISLVFSFWPVTVVVGSLALTTSMYIILGLVQHKLTERLFKRTISEHIAVGIAVLVIIFLTTHWGG